MQYLENRQNTINSGDGYQVGMVIIIVGVSGCGKTTIGKKVADRLELEFYDADSYHPISNISKMKSGIPLTDKDREPWLRHLASRIDAWLQGRGAVLACSALKEAYRKMLSQEHESEICFVHLTGPRDLIMERIISRDSHYFPPCLLDSQYDDLEEPKEAITVSVERNPDEITDEIIVHLAQRGLMAE